MIIEFAGLPGAGKSTLYKQIVETLEYSGCGPLNSSIIRQNHISNIPIPFGRKYGGHMQTILRAPRIYSYGIRSILKGDRPLFDKLISIKRFAVILDNYYYLKHSGPPEQIVVFDEGIVQRAVTVLIDAYSKVPPSAIKYFAREMPKPDLLIYLKVSPNIVPERVRKRPAGITPRLQDLDIGQLISVMQKAEVMFDTLVNYLQDSCQGVTTVVELDGNHLDTATIKLNSWLFSFVADLQHMQYNNNPNCD